MRSVFISFFHNVLFFNIYFIFSLYTFRLIAYSFSAFSFQIQYLPCFGRGSDFASQFLSDTNDLSYQLAIGFCQHPFFEIQIIFEPHSDISSHSDSRSSQSKGMASDTGCSPGRTCRNSIYKPAKIRNCCRRTPSTKLNCMGAPGT